jgi:hypothetical protein
MRMIESTIALTELLSLGFATIGVRRTLAAVGGQLLQDLVQTLRTRRQPISRPA